MDILKNQIDVDQILTSLYTKSNYTELFRSLLRNPTPVLLSKLVMNYQPKMLNDLKYLIKGKYSKLTLEVQKNIQGIALLLLGYTINVDVIIINLLRVGYSKFPLDHKYFKEFKYTLPFIKFHHNKSYIDDPKLVTTLITYDMEKDILFIASVQQNVKFYVTAFTSKYRNKIPDILLFVQSMNFSGRNIEYLVFNLNVVVKMGQSKGDVSWMIKDMVKEETVVECNSKVENMSNSRIDNISNSRVDNSKVDNISNSRIDNISNSKVDNISNSRIDNSTTKVESRSEIIPQNTPESFLHIIADLSFPKYYSLIQDMKRRKSPILDPKLYKAVVFASFEYDNYVQVYLWKILVYQKILFEIEIEIEENDLKTQESLEGYDIYLNIH